MTTQENESFGMLGIHTFKTYDSTNSRVRFIQDEIKKLYKKFKTPRERWEELQFWLNELKHIGHVKELTVKNKIVLSGRNVVGLWLSGDNTYSADDGVNYNALGTSAAVVADSNTQLLTEVYRKATTGADVIGDVLSLSCFYDQDEVVGTLQESGWFIAGTGAANSGVLFNRFLTGTLVKTNQESLTVESEVQFTST